MIDNVWSFRILLGNDSERVFYIKELFLCKISFDDCYLEICWKNKYVNFY